MQIGKSEHTSRSRGGRGTFAREASRAGASGGGLDDQYVATMHTHNVGIRPRCRESTRLLGAKVDDDFGGCKSFVSVVDYGWILSLATSEESKAMI
jgi:hypothetical protein